MGQILLTAWLYLMIKTVVRLADATDLSFGDVVFSLFEGLQQQGFLVVRRNENSAGLAYNGILVC